MKIVLVAAAAVVALAVFTGVGLVVLQTRVDDGLSGLTGDRFLAGQRAVLSREGCFEGWLWGGLKAARLIKLRVEDVSEQPVDLPRAHSVDFAYRVVTRVHSLYGFPVRTQFTLGDGGMICAA